MNILILLLILELVGIIQCYKKYLTSYSWTHLRKKLSDKNISYEDQSMIKIHIFNDYKFRAYLKAKKFKILNNELTKNIPRKTLGKYALNGLFEAINTFDPNAKINFAKHSDKYINKNLIIGLTNLSPYKNANHFNYNKWYDPYWNCINNDLSPLNKKIIQLKYDYNFDEIRGIQMLSKMFNTTTENITDITSTSLNYVYTKIKSQNDFSTNFFLSKLNL